jgi:hypothetical protein
VTTSTQFWVEMGGYDLDELEQAMKSADIGVAP